MGIVITNGRVINPATGLDSIADLRIEGDRVVRIAGRIEAEEGDRLIDAAGCYVMPGFIDLHVHLREPGQTDKETVETGSMAAARGGVTTLVAMPNTKPVADSPQIIDLVTKKAEECGMTHVLQAGSITKGMEGKELSDLSGMLERGIRAISEDGKSVMDSGLLREAMKIAADANIPVLAHCEDIRLVQGGVMNQGRRSGELSVPGISNAVENIIEARDIMLAEETGAALHLCHCSTKESYDLIREARAKGIRVSGEVCPHHFTLTEDDIPSSEDSNYKMNPPLRSKADRDALIRGLSDGTFEVISTDHAPHTDEEKAEDFLHAPFGIVGLETSASLTYTQLVKTGYLTPMMMAEKMSYNPARILHLDRGDISEGKMADVVVFDPNTSYVVDPKDFYSKGHNTPFAGWTLEGVVRTTILDGRIVYTRTEEEIER